MFSNPRVRVFPFGPISGNTQCKMVMSRTFSITCINIYVKRHKPLYDTYCCSDPRFGVWLMTIRGSNLVLKLPTANFLHSFSVARIQRWGAKEGTDHHPRVLPTAVAQDFVLKSAP